MMRIGLLLGLALSLSCAGCGWNSTPVNKIAGAPARFRGARSPFEGASPGPESCRRSAPADSSSSPRGRACSFFLTAPRRRSGRGCASPGTWRPISTSETAARPCSWRTGRCLTSTAAPSDVR